MEANIYILSSLKKESAMPKLLDAIYKKHLKVLLYCNTDEDMQNIDALLWRYSKLSFLPHGTSEDTHKDKHPIYITKDVLDIQSNTEILYIDEDLDEVLNHESKKFLQKKFKKIICMYE
ncbi:MAG: DNA polymerase III subunit chi, partial [Proteobacteria bacterium]|nr:DNA polymerase III subunit chi [Pseudomonadota bacterium]